MPETTYKRTIKLILWIAGTILLLYLLYLLVDVIILITFSVLLAFIFAPFVFMLEQKGFSRLSSTLIVFGALGILIYLGMSVFIPQFSDQMNLLSNRFEGFSITDQLKDVQEWLKTSLPFLDKLSTEVDAFISSQLKNSVASLTTLLTSIVSIIAIVVIVPFITFFLLKDSKKILQGVLQMVPNKYFEMAYWIIKKVSLKLGLFVRAWIFDATFVGALIGVGFYLIGVPNALPLGVIAGLGHLIPYFGPVVGGVPAILISVMSGDTSQIPLIIIIVLGVYTIDNGFVQPVVFGKSVDIHPIMIILLIIAGSQIFGLIGMLLAVPVATVIKTMAKEINYAFTNYRIARV